ncbi:MAG: hypothetical protein JO104_06035, partial [Candidatus Eremiobacteraeota bacterium]|nr:hypothetical protein [Candidatus Eremiobacteraeota bacterium]
MRNAERVGAALLIAAMMGLLSIDRYSIAPAWLAGAIFPAIILAMVVAAVSKSAFWHRVELVVLWAAVVLGVICNAFNLWNVVNKLAFQSVKASTLFYTALTIWVYNVVNFTLIYWLLDGGGPDVRNIGATTYPDFDFPAISDPKRVRPDWKPTLADYLFLGFTTS